VARAYGPDQIDNKTVDAGIGSRMIGRANQLLAEAYEVELGSDDEVVLNQYGQPTLLLDTDGHPILKPVTENTDVPINRVRNYVGLLDASVDIGMIVSQSGIGVLSPESDGPQR
jgi:hypothetical protein